MIASRALRTVAVAEDPFIGRFLRTLLGRHGFQTVDNDLSVTLKLMESGQLKPDFLITNTPGAFSEFADQVRIVYLAATPDPALVRAFRNSRTLRKPFQAEQLLQALDELTAAR
jgi:hypothetical protein